MLTFIFRSCKHTKQKLWGSHIEWPQTPLNPIVSQVTEKTTTATKITWNLIPASEIHSDRFFLNLPFWRAKDVQNHPHSHVLWELQVCSPRKTAEVRGALPNPRPYLWAGSILPSPFQTRLVFLLHETDLGLVNVFAVVVVVLFCLSSASKALWVEGAGETLKEVRSFVS